MIRTITRPTVFVMECSTPARRAPLPKRAGDRQRGGEFARTARTRTRGTLEGNAPGATWECTEIVRDLGLPALRPN